MGDVAADLASRGARLDYWFIKFYAGDLAFLVDYIVRRETGQGEVRVSLWVRGAGRVLVHTSTSWDTDGGIRIGENVLDDRGCRGAVDDAEWNLTYEVHSSRATPRVPLLSRWNAFDLASVIRPRVAFSGSVTVAGERFEVDDAYGILIHYWGRRLPDRWHWISAGAVDGTGTAVEAMAMTSKLWGRGPSLDIGYLWTREGEQERMLISPMNGVIKRSGDLTEYAFVGRRLRSATKLRCAADPGSYNDLGEGIHQTLLGRCTVDGKTELQAALEYRLPPAEGA
jgi:hypothetical protein